MLKSNPSVAVVGCGYWGQNLVRNFAELGVLSTVCDTTEEGRARARKIVPAVSVVRELHEVLGSAADGVVIATPAATHFDLACRAVSAGKHVFVEKPLAVTYQQGLQLVRLANDLGRILMVGHVLEYHPAVVRLCEIVASGELGRVYYIYSNRLNLGKVREEESILWSFAPHDIAVILNLLGSMPFQVNAMGGSYLQPNFPDVTVTHLLFDIGVRAHIYVSWLHPFKEQRLVVVGSEKMASFDDVAKELVLYDQRVHIRNGRPVPVKGEGHPVLVSSGEPLRLECEAFLSSLRDGAPPKTDGQSGLRVLKVLQAAQRSLVMNGEAVRLPFERASEFARSSPSVRTAAGPGR